MHIIKIKPDEIKTIGIDYTGKMPTGAALSSAAVSLATDRSTGKDVKADILSSPTAAIASSVAQLTYQNCVNGHDYIVYLTAVLDDGTELQDTITVVCDKNT